MEQRDYKAWLDAKEHDLRWLIGRRPYGLEFRYYLVFLLAAHRQDAKARQECREILAIAPGDLMARTWLHQLTARRFEQGGRKRRSRRAARWWKCGRCAEA